MAGTAALKGWKDDYQHKLVTAEEAAAQVKSGDWIIVPPVNSVPIDILNALAARKDEIQKVKIASNLMIYPLRSWGATMSARSRTTPATAARWRGCSCPRETSCPSPCTFQRPT